LRQPDALAERGETLSRVLLQGFENQPIFLVQDHHPLHLPLADDSSLSKRFNRWVFL
jgi:hypothetical protein